MRPIEFIRDILNILFCKTKSYEINIDPEVARAEHIGVARTENQDQETLILDAGINPPQARFLPVTYVHFIIPTPSERGSVNDVHDMQPSDVVMQNPENHLAPCVWSFF